MTDPTKLSEDELVTQAVMAGTRTAMKAGTELRRRFAALTARIAELEADHDAAAGEALDADRAAFKAEAERDALKEALERLGSMEAFEGAMDLGYAHARAIKDELVARIQFARAALAALSSPVAEEEGT